MPPTMEKNVGVIIICFLILIMDVVAGILGFEAEIAQNKGKHMRVLFIECKEPVHEAYQMGLAAAILLGLSHVMANLFCGWSCSQSKDGKSANGQLFKTCLVLSWIVVILGFVLLLIGAISNSKSRTSCGVSNHLFLSIGGIMCFVHAVLCIVFCVSLSTQTSRSSC